MSGGALHHSDAVLLMAGQMTDAEKHSIIKSELDKVSASRPPHERIVAFAILKEPFSPDNGTLTRTMKPRRAVILQKYASEVEVLKKKLR